MTHKNYCTALVLSDRQRQVFRQHQKKENYSKKKKMAQKRKGLTLDLNAAAGVGPSGHGIFSKKSKLAASHILTSPDVQKLKLSSPELAEFLTRNPTLATPTPSGGNYIFPKTVTEEQESYVKGFEVALKNLQQHQIPEQTITGSHVGKFSRNNFFLSNGIHNSYILIRPQNFDWHFIGQK